MKVILGLFALVAVAQARYYNVKRDGGDKKPTVCVELAGYTGCPAATGTATTRELMEKLRNLLERDGGASGGKSGEKPKKCNGVHTIKPENLVKATRHHFKEDKKARCHFCKEFRKHQTPPATVTREAKSCPANTQEVREFLKAAKDAGKQIFFDFENMGFEICYPQDLFCVKKPAAAAATTRDAGGEKCEMPKPKWFELDETEVNAAALESLFAAAPKEAIKEACEEYHEHKEGKKSKEKEHPKPPPDCTPVDEWIEKRPAVLAAIKAVFEKFCQKPAAATTRNLRLTARAMGGLF